MILNEPRVEVVTGRAGYYRRSFSGADQWAVVFSIAQRLRSKPSPWRRVVY